MLSKQTTYTQRVTVQAPPYDLADGKFEIRSAVLRSLFVVGTLVGAAAAAWVALAIWPDYDAPNAAQIVGLGLCGLAGGFLLFFGWKSGRLMLRGWDSYQLFLDRSRDAYLDAYIDSDGQEVEQQVRVNEINVNDIRDMLALVVYIHMTGQTSLSKMSGPLLVNDGRRMVSLGRMTDYGAEVAGKRLERAGVLVNAGAGKGRRLPSNDLEGLVTTLLRSWEHKEVAE